MRRNMDEILASQKQMLIRRGEPADKVDDQTMADLFAKHLDHIEDWIASQANIETIYINYNQILNDPNHLTKEVVKFLGDNLDVLPMLGIIDHNLYRQRQKA